MATVRTSLSLPEELVAKIDKRAQKLGLNRSSFVVYCVSKQFEQEEAMSKLPEMLELVNRLEAVKNALPKCSD